jgi:hypothetical protein
MTAGKRAGSQARYGLLLITLVAAYLVSAVTHTRQAGAIHVVFVAAMAVMAVRHARLRRRVALAGAGITLATAVAAGACALFESRTANGIASLWSGLVLLLIVTSIVDRVLRLERVTVQSIYGALSAYLLVGLMFAAWYGALDYLVAEPFFADGQPANTQTLQYFSFTTLTTLGYGDFTAAGSLGRAVAVIEALAGQVFLATLIARLMSAYGADRRQRPPDG